MENENWFKMLKLLLSFGNCLNAGSNRSKAYGFKLSSLTKFSDSKD